MNEAEMVEDDDEIESERWAVNEDNAKTTSNQSKKKLDKQSSSNFSLNEINEDEQDRRSHFKVVKEFEKTLEFVKNASNLKVMPSLSLNQQVSNEEIVPPHYDESDAKLVNKLKEQAASSDDSDSDAVAAEDDEEEAEPDELPARNLLKGVNLIINNSIDSHMLTSSYSMRSQPTQSKPGANMKKLSHYDKIKMNKRETTKSDKKYFISRCNSTGSNKIISDRKQINDSDGYRGDLNPGNCEEAEFIDDEMSLFKNDTLMTNRLSDYKAFKTPLEQEVDTHQSTANLLYKYNSRLLANRNNQVFVQKHSELKVFNPIDTTVQSINLNHIEAMKADIPKNSTPISTDNSVKHRHLLNAQLNLTIVPAPQYSQTLDARKLSTAKSNKENLAKTQETQKSVFLVPQVPPITSGEEKKTTTETLKKQASLHANMFKTSTLKSNSNLIINNNNIYTSHEAKSKIGQQLLATDILNVSKISALENATATNSCVVVAKADMPKDLKKSFKDEIKKDKNKCSIS